MSFHPAFHEPWPRVRPLVATDGASLGARILGAAARWLASGLVCLFSSSAAFCQNEDASSGAVLWDTRAVAEDGNVDPASRRTWRQIEPGATTGALTGDVVIENEHITVVLGRRSAGPLVSPKAPASPLGRNRSRLVTLASAQESAVRLGEMIIRTNTEDEVALDVLAQTETGRKVTVNYRLARGQAFIECRPIQNADRIRVESATRFVVIPDFFGADMVFDPRAYPQSSLVIPPENFVLGLVEGENTIVMSVWPTGDQQVSVKLSGAGEERRISATEISFDGKSVSVAVLHAPGIWHERRLQDPYVDQDVALEWRKPFQAKWRANFCNQRQSDSWDFQDHRSETWMYLYQAIVWPCWFDGEDGFVRLSRRFVDVKGPMQSVLVYAADRRKDTPLTTFTPVDIVRNTLGVGPCEYVLDREGLQGRSANTGRKNFGRGVCDTTTPIEYLFIQGLEARESALIGHLVDDILADISAINARVLEFCAFARQLHQVRADEPRDLASESPLDEMVEKTARDIDGLYEAKLPVIQNPAHATELGQRIKGLATRHDPENLGECKILTRELRDIAGTQHLMVGDYRVMAKRLRQEAGIHAAENAAAAKLAEKVRKLSGQVLRRKYGVEAD